MTLLLEQSSGAQATTRFDFAGGLAVTWLPPSRCISFNEGKDVDSSCSTIEALM